MVLVNVVGVGGVIPFDVSELSVVRDVLVCEATVQYSWRRRCVEVCWARRVGRRDSQAKVPTVLVVFVVGTVWMVAKVLRAGGGLECWDSWFVIGSW